MRPRWITTLDEFTALAPAWDRALAASGSDNPYLLSDYLLTWCGFFLPPGGLRILACFEDGVLRAGLPLYLARRAPGIPVLRVVGCGFANLTEPFFPPGGEAVFRRACARALGRLRGWRYLTLGLARGPWFGLAGEMPEAAARFSTTARICLGPGQGAAAYLQTLNHKQRGNVRRHLREAAAAGGAELRRETDPGAVAAMIEFQLHHNGPNRYGPDDAVPAPPEAWDEFFRVLLIRLAARGRLDAMALRIGGELAALEFGFRHGAGFKSMLASFDPRFGRLGPGSVLVYHLIDWCARRGDPYIEMYAPGADLHKRRWCNAFEPLYRVRVFPDTAPGRLLQWASRRRG